MRVLMASFVVAVWGMLPSVAVHADREWEESTSHYEDDAWYDVSEWFDGNDYNPTDEEWDEWDDETFQHSDEVEANSDNDWSFGYNSSTSDDNWFYDYYDEGAYSSYNSNESDNTYDVGSRFYDYDNDGSYDAYSTFYDWDQDGLYEDYNYYFFSDKGSKKQQDEARAQTPTESRKQQLTAKVQHVKQVDVRGGQNLVVAIQHQGKDLFVDLGRADRLKKFDLKEGDKITVSGQKTRIGEKQVLIAQSLQAAGQKTEINRDRRQFQGKVVSTRQAKVRGSQHLIAMVDTQRGQNKNKVAVDLGPANKLNMKVQEGTGLTFRGVPVKVKDRKMLLALYVQDNNGQWKQIDRRKSKSKS